MSGRQGGKAKPLRAKKKAEKFEDDDDIAFKKKQQEEKKALAAMVNKAKGNKSLVTGGIKRSGGSKKK